MKEPAEKETYFQVCAPTANIGKPEFEGSRGRKLIPLGNIMEIGPPFVSRGHF